MSVTDSTTTGEPRNSSLVTVTVSDDTNANGTADIPWEAVLAVEGVRTGDSGL
jgi:hypothetical protein